jgi:hypothetical protein
MVCMLITYQEQDIHKWAKQCQLVVRQQVLNYCMELAHPLVYASSRPPPKRGSCDAATYANSVASTGVLHGDAARANVRPAR